MPEDQDKIAVAEHKWVRKVYEQLSWEFVDHPGDPTHDELVDDCRLQAEQIQRVLRGFDAQKRIFINIDERRAFEHLYEQVSSKTKDIETCITLGDIDKAQGFIDDSNAMIGALNSALDQGQQTSDEIHALGGKVQDTKQKIAALDKAHKDIVYDEVRDEFLSLQAVANECTHQAEFYTRAGRIQDTKSAIAGQTAALAHLEAFVATIPYAQAQLRAEEQHQTELESSAQESPEAAESLQAKSDVLRAELESLSAQIAQKLSQTHDIQDQILLDEIAAHKMLAEEYSREVEVCLEEHRVTDAEMNLNDLKGIERDIENCLRVAANDKKHREARDHHIEQQRLAEKREAERRAEEERRAAEAKAAEERRQEELRMEHERKQAAQKQALIDNYEKTLQEADQWLTSMATSLRASTNPTIQEEFQTYRTRAQDLMSQVKVALFSGEPEQAEPNLLELARVLTNAQRALDVAPAPQPAAKAAGEAAHLAEEKTATQPQEPKKKRIAYKNKKPGIRNDVDAREKPTGPNPEFYCEVQEGQFCLKHAVNACLGFQAATVDDLVDAATAHFLADYKKMPKDRFLAKASILLKQNVNRVSAAFERDPKRIYRAAASAEYKNNSDREPLAAIYSGGCQVDIGINLIKAKQEELGLPEPRLTFLGRSSAPEEVAKSVDKLSEIIEQGSDRIIFYRHGHYITLRKNAEGDWFEVDSKKSEAVRVDPIAYYQKNKLAKDSLPIIHFDEEITYQKPPRATQPRKAAQRPDAKTDEKTKLQQQLENINADLKIMIGQEGSVQGSQVQENFATYKLLAEELCSQVQHSLSKNDIQGAQQMMEQLQGVQAGLRDCLLGG